MIDFTKNEISDFDPIWIIENCSPTLEANAEGEVTKWLVNYLDIIKLKVCRTKLGTYILSIDGSLQRLYNSIVGNGNISHNDITHDNLMFAIDHLCTTFRLNVDQIEAIRTEYSINIDMLKPPQQILDKCIYLLKGKNPTIDKEFKGKGKKLIFEVSDLEVKLYVKSTKEKFILRVEIQTTRSRETEKYGIKTLADLYNPDTLIQMNNKLLERIKALQIIDDLECVDLTREEINTIDTFTIKKKRDSHRKKLKSTPSKFNYQEGKFLNLLKEKNLLNTKNHILDQIKLKGIKELEKIQGVSNSEDSNYSTIHINGLIRNQPISKAERIVNPVTTKLHRIYPIEIAHLHNDHPLKKACRNRDSNSRNNCRNKYKKKIKELNKPSLFGSEILVLDIPKSDYLLLKYFEGTPLDILPKLNYRIVG